MEERRRPLIAGNWKMYKTCSEAVQTSEKLVSLVSDVTDRDVMIAPPFTALSSVSEVIRKSRVDLGAQNLFWESEGAYTGEISPSMLVSIGCQYVIIGHSERRQYFGETDETINKKIRAALDFELIPILCIGETESERESEKTFSVLDKQLQKGLKDFSSKDVSRLVVAYEPVWAIGTGKTASTEQAQEVHQYVRSLIEKKFGISLAKSIRIVYGGSVKLENISELMKMSDIDGALVGGASLKADIFSKIVHFQMYQ
jgi:triosephosphate isomerase